MSHSSASGVPLKTGLMAEALGKPEEGVAHALKGRIAPSEANSVLEG
jgi:hypothetical protein